MIFVDNTPNCAGVSICGDYMDFENLYDALHAVVGEEGEFVRYDTARLRVLGVCYDIRHALMGDREIEFVDNGIDHDKKIRMSVLAHDKNVYLKTNTLWPEILFVLMALNDFIRLRAGKTSKKGYDIMFDKDNIWDGSITTVRFFQTAVARCIRETVTPASFRRMLSFMNKNYTWFDNYTDQYLDILNCRFIAMDREKRLKNIPTVAKRLAERGEEYMEVKASVAESARHHNTTEDNIQPPVDYPDDFEW